ncbi:hypothetical protein HCG48_21335 [Oxynema aestuarii AP17]|uniref:Uncharacterized protein n=1 Tax=Oxynema aestuarii AP17 TaxID=2064643 RepID=A0A6H1U5C5_9CYAN|nr:hypothetical protein HCG48_21335 [Oxynema aestuarii AP17]
MMSIARSDNGVHWESAIAIAAREYRPESSCWRGRAIAPGEWQAVGVPRSPTNGDR